MVFPGVQILKFPGEATPETPNILEVFKVHQSRNILLRAKETSSFPKSLLVLKMLKIGQRLLNCLNSTFMTWSTNSTTVNFVVDEEVLAAGGFREVFKATSDAREFADSTWVIKKYLPEAVTIIGKTNETV